MQRMLVEQASPSPERSAASFGGGSGRGQGFPGIQAQGDYARAAELMQILVDFEREIGHPDAEKHAQWLAEVRGKVRE